MTDRPRAQGEEATAAALAALPPSWMALHDLTWPGRPHDSIDHLVVGPPGVFVIDSRTSLSQDWSGSIAAAAAAAAAVSELVASVRFDHVHGVMCFDSQDVDIGWVDGVLVCSAAELVEELTSYVEVIPGGVGKVVAADLQRRLSAASGPRPVTSPPAGFADRMEAARQQAASTRKPISHSSLVRLAVGFTVAIVLVTQPRVVSSVSSDIADFVVEQVNPGEPEQPRVKKPVNNRKKQQQNQDRRQKQ